jgi:hypothetical protein
MYLRKISVKDITRDEQTIPANDGPVRIQYKCLVPRNETARSTLFPKQNYNVLSPIFHIHVSVIDLCIPRISLSILLQPNRQNDPTNK